MRPLRVHFSCGAASAVSLFLAVATGADVSAVYADPGGEHEDAVRFREDVERASGVPITVARSERFANPMEVWRKERFMKGPNGASCSRALKHVPLQEFMTPEHDHVFGFTSAEGERLARIQEHEAPLVIRSLLVERGLTKEDCFQELHARGIELPAMYRLGFNNANCIGCPKGGKGYWNKVRKVFPGIFEETSRLQQELGQGAAFWQGKDKRRIMLADLSPRAGRHNEPNIQCDMFCADRLTPGVGAGS